MRGPVRVPPALQRRGGRRRRGRRPALVVRTPVAVGQRHRQRPGHGQPPRRERRRDVQLRLVDQQHGRRRTGARDRGGGGGAGRRRRPVAGCGVRQSIATADDGRRRYARGGVADRRAGRSGHGGRRVAETVGVATEAAAATPAAADRATAVLRGRQRGRRRRRRQCRRPPRHRSGQHGPVLQFSHERERVRRSGRVRRGRSHLGRRADGRHVRRVQDWRGRLGHDTQRQGHNQGRQEPRQGWHCDVPAAQNQQGKTPLLFCIITCSSAQKPFKVFKRPNFQIPLVTLSLPHKLNHQIVDFAGTMFRTLNIFCLGSILH